MLSAVKNFLAHQARRPSGWFGRTIAPLVFKHENKHMEDFGLELMQPAGDDVILEIGFGQGRLLSRMLPKLESGKACGIDISEEMVAAASQRNKNWIQTGKLELQQADIDEIPYPDTHFDKVFTCNTIYFWPEPFENAREVNRVLQPQGTFYCAFRDKQLMESKSSAVTENPEVFQNLYQPEEVSKLFREAGFRNVRHEKRYENEENIHIIVGEN